MPSGPKMKVSTSERATLLVEAIMTVGGGYWLMGSPQLPAANVTSHGMSMAHDSLMSAGCAGHIGRRSGTSKQKWRIQRASSYGCHKESHDVGKSRAFSRIRGSFLKAGTAIGARSFGGRGRGVSGGISSVDQTGADPLSVATATRGSVRRDGAGNSGQRRSKCDRYTQCAPFCSR